MSSPLDRGLGGPGELGPLPSSGVQLGTVQIALFDASYAWQSTVTHWEHDPRHLPRYVVRTFQVHGTSETKWVMSTSHVIRQLRRYATRDSERR